MKIDIVNLGLTEYDYALSIQKKLHRLRSTHQVDDVLLLLEHPALITLGKRASEKHVLATRQELYSKGIKTYISDRGGDVTYHGPGQIIGYAIFDIRNHGNDVREFVRKLEEVFIGLLRSFYNISSFRDPKHAGVWVNHEKILAIGLSVKRYITTHGFAFNVNTNLEHFNLIVPCGIKDKGVTSLSHLLGYTPDQNILKEQVALFLGDTFKVPCVTREKDWLLSIISNCET